MAGTVVARIEVQDASQVRQRFLGIVHDGGALQPSLDVGGIQFQDSAKVAPGPPALSRPRGLHAPLH
jgi:hypothetical protein